MIHAPEEPGLSLLQYIVTRALIVTGFCDVTRSCIFTSMVTVTCNMAAQAEHLMTDEEPRALLTDRERDILLGDADVSEGYYYTVVSRVRGRIQQLHEDLPALEAHATLGDELRDIVCEDDQDE